MKKVFSFAIYAMAALAMVLAMGSCKKEKEEVTAKAIDIEAQALQNRINAFQTLREKVNSGMKSEGAMTLEEMRETLCLVANYEHSDHEAYCLNSTLDTLRVTMPAVDMNGNVSESDVVIVYNDFEAAFQNKMAEVGDDMDVPSLFSIVLPVGVAKESEEIEIIFTRGEETESLPLPPTVNGPFDGLCYYWGWRLGPCNGSFGIFGSDAALEMTKQFKFDYSAYNGTFYFWDVEYVDYVSTNVYLITHPEWIYWEPGYVTDCEQWLFHYLGALPDSLPEPCLCEDLLNCEYVNIKNDISLTNGGLYYSPVHNSPFFECRISSKYEKNPEEGRLHVVHVTYANYHYTPYQN